MVKDARVAHPRRAEWSQVVSSVLNIEVVSMVSSLTSLLLIQTPAAGDLILRSGGKRKKDRVCTRSKEQISNKSLEPKLPERCRYGFGVVLAGAVDLAGAGFGAGFGAVLLGEDFGAVLGAGAGTPD